MKNNGRTTKPVGVKSFGSNISRHELHNYNPRTSNMINRKNGMLEYLKVMEWKLTGLFYTPPVNRKMNNANYKGYVNKKSNEEIDNGDKCHSEAILDSFKFKRLERIQPEEPLEGDEVKMKIFRHATSRR